MSRDPPGAGAHRGVPVSVSSVARSHLARFPLSRLERSSRPRNAASWSVHASAGKLLNPDSAKEGCPIRPQLPLLRHVATAVVIASVLAGTAPIAMARAPVIVAAGDIGCGGDPCQPQRQTAALIRRMNPRAVLTLGDAQYPDGAYSDFLSSYRPTWGRFIKRTHPSPGNHEYYTQGASGYYRYFGRRAHQNSGGTYTFNIGAWHVVSINTGDGRPESSLIDRVRRNLARDRHRCELAYWHQPAFSSGTEHGSDERMRDLWRMLSNAGVDVVLNGHEHNYERFAPLDARGRPNARSGMREFVVGTGGGSELYRLGSGIRGSQRRIDGRYGVLRMRLRARSYAWKFVSVAGSTLDRGRTKCHG